MIVVSLVLLYASVRRKNYDWFIASLLGIWGSLYSFVIGVVEKNIWEFFFNFPDHILMRLP